MLPRVCTEDAATARSVLPFTTTAWDLGTRKLLGATYPAGQSWVGFHQRRPDGSGRPAVALSANGKMLALEVSGCVCIPYMCVRCFGVHVFHVWPRFEWGQELLYASVFFSARLHVCGSYLSSLRVWVHAICRFDPHAAVGDVVLLLWLI